MEFIPLLPEEFYSPPPPTNLKSSSISKAWREIFNGKQTKKMDIKTSYPRYLIKTSNKEEEE